MAPETQVHFNKQYLEQEVRKLASDQVVTLSKKPLQKIDPILSSSREVLIDTYRELASAAKKQKELSTAGEWLIDNFYIIQEQIVELNEDLPYTYYEKLPRLSEGNFKGYPRIYELVQKLAAISDNIIDKENTLTAVQAYQNAFTLKLGELWAVPIIVRFALIVRLAERSRELLKQRKLTEKANSSLEVILNSRSDEPGYVLRKLSELDFDECDDRQLFLTILARKLQARGLFTDTERQWFDYQFSKLDTTLEKCLRSLAQKTSQLHLSIQNAISSLRKVSESSWADFIERCSVVEKILRLDPAGYYAEMDFKTRDTYRKKIEKLSSHSKFTEDEVAEKILQVAESRLEPNTETAKKEAHVGYYLMDEGYDEILDVLQYKMPWLERFQRYMERHKSGYFLFIFFHLITFLAIVSIFSNYIGAPLWLTATALVVAFMPALELSVVSTNRILAFFIPPRILPKMEFAGEIPDRHRTMVVVPTLLGSVEDALDQIEALEIRAMANPGRCLQFVLLSDYHDAPEEHMPKDKEILNAAIERIEELNQRHNCKYGSKFHLFHRNRKWNPVQNSWMGWERKRGKIEELNHLLLNPDAETDFFPLQKEFLEGLKHVPVSYVITLDADTKLPPDSAIDLVRTAAHPLNRAEMNEAGNLVKHGYGIIQPRISIPPKSANRTWFSKVFSGNVGIDPYTTAVSDIYQDLFGEGVYTGKGLYDVRAFHAILDERFPENTVLSHDLLESTYLRAALVTDIELFDDYPSTYLSFSRRNHRWIRGDWQIAQWLFSRVPAQGLEKDKNPINSISKWKIFDNLRRSLNPFFILVFLLADWLFLPGSPLIGTIAALGIIAFPIYSSFSVQIFTRPTRVAWKLYFEKVKADMKVNTLQAFTTLMFMPHQAYVSLDAIVRTVWRMAISNRLLLEWVSASQTEKQSNAGMIKYYRKMWPNIFWSLLCVSMAVLFATQVLYLIIPFALLWTFTPYFAWWMSRELKSEKPELSKEDLRELRMFGRRTWHFFDRFVTEEHSWLPPDNFQEDPYLGSVNRTSPTNIGLSLTALIAAYDSGYIALKELLDKIGNTLGSMKFLEKYNGHFYNWYDIEKREVLHPRYISTVDSGNLAGSLVVVKQALQQLKNAQWPNPAFCQGLRETLWVLEDILITLQQHVTSSELWKEIEMTLKELKEALPGEGVENIVRWKGKLNQLKAIAIELDAIEIKQLIGEKSSSKVTDIEFWFGRPFSQIQLMLDEINEVEDGEHFEGWSAYEGKELLLEDLKAEHVVSNWQARLRKFAGWCDEMIYEMDFNLLYKRDRKLFSIGYNVDRASLDESTYDLFASEARMASYLAIAKGEVSPEHWFSLSRRLTSINRNEILLSWGGTMFEYLMPLLYMSRYEDTLLSNTYDNVVKWQENYGNSRNYPWGFSESGYGVLNLELHYQYRSFGAPGLGLKRGLAENYVVAPYASMLALMVDPKSSLKNLRELKKEGAFSLYGFYESIDYSNRVNESEGDKTIVKMYMAHHQGMILLSLSNVLNSNRIQNLFHNDPLVQSCDLLLQERIPRGIPIKEPRPIDVELEPGKKKEGQVEVEHAGQESLTDAPPRTHILSNGHYSTVITHTGSGYSYCGNLTLTRWRPDKVYDPYGLFFYIKDLETNEYWSMGHTPVGRKADRYDSWFHPGKVQIARVDEWTESFMEVCVSPEDNIELRKLTITNYADRKRKFEISSYTEIVINEQETDLAHPAFSNLFVQTDHIPEHHALVAQRKPRSEDEKPVWLVHTLAAEESDNGSGPMQFETDRGAFIGRGRDLKEPVAMDMGHRFEGTLGNVPDPIFSIRKTIDLKPGEKISLTFGLGKVNNKEEAIAIADRYDNPYATDRVFELASLYGNVELDHIGLNGHQANYFQKLSGAMIYGCERLRAGENILKKNRKKQPGLWSYGISGDLPIIIYSIHDTEYLRNVELLLKAHSLWRLKGFDVDLVIINDHPPSYIDELQDSIHDHIQKSMERQRVNKRGGIFVLRSDEVQPEDRVLLFSVAEVVLAGHLPKLKFGELHAENMERESPRKTFKPIDLRDNGGKRFTDPDELMFYNGYGGFTQDGKEYVIHLNAKRNEKDLTYPPAPWINVIANEEFGFLSSETGSGYTWSRNSRENRLTPWSNDAVMDPPGEALFIRDEENGIYWSPTPKPIPGSGHYEVRHGFGYSKYKTETLNIEQELTVWTAPDDPVKIIRLELKNTGLYQRKLRLFRYLDWVLGVFRHRSSKYVHTEWHGNTEGILARNYYNNEFAEQVAFTGQFSSTKLQELQFTSDRLQFLGKNQSLKNPVVLGQDIPLNDKFGIGFDPCAASSAVIDLGSGKKCLVYYLLGEAESEDQAIELLKKYHNQTQLEQSLTHAKEMWDTKLNGVQIATPELEFNFLANGWLQYQNIACRMWARTGFYQSGGAYGFRDQLQDSSSAIYIDKQLTRNQIKLHASHQFEEGDVLHWWHPPTDRGTRTRISDDLLWLPYVTALYLRRTNDIKLLKERVPFVRTRSLNDGEQEAYLEPETTSHKASIYEHCCRAIDKSLTKGNHGLPLMGAGDWNDSMNRVGENGQGESVWLGFFLYKILDDFLPICKKQGDEDRVETYKSFKTELKKHLNSEGWDGEWYRRAFYDDGTPLGSSENDECIIDAIAQSWAVISGAATPEKAAKALESAEKHLISESDGLIRLLVPPFESTEKNPGYIKGYMPGVRENGGQYTHAAVWLVRALAESGYGRRAVELMKMLTPVTHSLNKEQADRYKVEPYAVAADIYGEPPLTGMGGWTWYTGSAGWMYRVILESILGLEIVNEHTLLIDPSISPDWKEFSISLNNLEKGTRYDIKVTNPDGLEKGTLEGSVDGKPIPISGGNFKIKLKQDGKTHHITLSIQKKA
ncbi:glycosyltransferase 36 [Balneolaceae bacterium YR4-1]|uniref:Glycosyltransferase 36 n=1 Tax=Halalkalibaculum roseum TaxID=2709311 RepID=A0A6M1SUD2_9BACT|nr:glucoamylase family protein [Halalkalibaculum roseum]NGP76550.1 glycosyltransferase 36 [Halalkalibaculum roseum]